MARARVYLGKRLKAQRGFTLVELITVVILIGILSVTVIPRFQDASGISEYTYQDRLISALRKLQVQAMHDSRANFCFQMNFVAGSVSPAFGVPSEDFTTGNHIQACQASIDFTSSEYMRTDNSELSAAGLTLSVKDGSDDITSLGFDSLGRPLTSQASCALGCEIIFTGLTSAKVCVESQGFIHAC